MINYKVDKVKNIQILDKDTLKPIADWGGIDNATIESEVEPSSLSKEVLQFNHSASFEGKLTDCSSLVNHVTDLYNKPFYIECCIPILIQARWHKKRRINKKWLKRYGMKRDEVLVKCDVISMYINTECENPYEIEHKFNLDLDSMEYKFRPEQLRRNLKMELYYG